MHRDAVDDGVGARHIHVFEDARHMLGIVGALPGMHLAVEIDEDRLARLDVAHQFIADHVERHGLRGEHVLRALIGLTAAVHQRTDAVRIAEREDAEADDQDRDRVGAARAPVYRRHRAEDMIGRELQAPDCFQFVGEYIQQDFRIGFGVDVAQVFAEQFVFEFGGVGEVTVVGERQTERRIDEERLCLGRRIATGGRIAHMADAHVAVKRVHVAGVEHVAHQAIVLAQIHVTSVAGENAGGVLAAMLHHRQTVVNSLIDRCFRQDTNNAAHRREASDTLKD